MNLLFTYSFTQNSDKEEKKPVMTQHFKRSIKVKSQSPLKLEWDVKNGDPFIQNLKLRNENLQVAPLVAPLDEEFWVNCTLTSQSNSKVIHLSKANIEIIEKQNVKLIRSVYLGGSNAIDLLGAASVKSDVIRLEPGESFQCVYLLKSDSTSFEDVDPLNEGM